MRVLKFRAWDKERKQMRYQDKEFFYVGLYRGLNGNEFYKDCGGGIDNFFTPIQGEIMQYIGIKDKNGKEIYESDIVKMQSCGIGKIIWFKLGFYWIQKPYNENEFMSGPQEFDNIENLKVLGNIFENPELLE